MEENPYFFDLVAAFVYWIVGLRLLALSRSTRGRPEFLLSLTYLSAGVSYFLYELPTLLAAELVWVLIAARILYSVGIVPLLLFTLEVFRRGSRWATALVWAIELSLFSGVFFSMLAGDIEGLVVNSVWFWCDWVGYTAPYVWISVEAAIAYRAAKKRQALGLCRPEDSNRLLLWALFGIFAALGSASLVPLYLDYATTQVWSRWGDYGSGGLEAAATVMLWLAFFPPGFYRRWVNRAAGAAADASD